MEREQKITVYLVLAVVALGVCETRMAKGRTVEPEPEPLIREVADAVIRDRPHTIDFNWGQGVLMAGMVRAGIVLDEPRYIEYVQKWADHWKEEGIQRILEESGRGGYCGHWGPGLPVLMLCEHTGEERYLEMAKKIVDYMDGATRTSRGGLGHWRGAKWLWVDTLYMACPVYVRYGRLTENPRCVQEAVTQLRIFAGRLQDGETGLFRHSYKEPEDKVIGTFWCRGNGWTAMSYAEVLRTLDRDSEGYAARVEEFRNLMDGILAMQDKESGLWPTVLDHEDTYLEISGSAMFLYTMTQAYRENFYDFEDLEPLQDAWQGIAAKVDEDGKVMGVSAGTGPSNKVGSYTGEDRGRYTWGTGAWLLAATSLTTLD